MESKTAFEFLLGIAKKKKFDLLSEYLQNSEPIKINVSKLPIVQYLISVVVSQQLSTKAAKTIWLRVHPIIKNAIDSGNIFEQLHSAGLSKPKVGYVVGLLGNLELHSANRADLIKMSKEDFEHLLISNKGIGPWSVHMARMFYLGDTDVLPINDLGIKHAHDNFFKKYKMNEDFYKVFSPWRTYLSLIMWRSLN